MPSLSEIFSREAEAVEVVGRRRPARKRAPQVVEERAVASDDYGLPGVEAQPVELERAPSSEPTFPLTRGEANEYGTTTERGNWNERERRQVFMDLWQELRHNQPPATRKGLAERLREIAAAPVLVMERDALIRLAAWAIAAATEKGLEMPAQPAPVSALFIHEDERAKARV